MTVRSMDGALCAQTDPELFYPPKGGTPEPAKRICAKCPLRAPCLEEGLYGEEYGVWGGLTPKERRRHPRWRVRPHWSVVERSWADAMILRLRDAGWGSHEIAAELGLSPGYIRTRTDALYQRERRAA